MTPDRIRAIFCPKLRPNTIIHASCILIVFLSGFVILSNRTLWFDEATYYVNIRDASWYQLFLPLPFYDQAAPFGYSLIIKIIHGAAGLNEVFLRLPSFLALALVGMVASRYPGLSDLEKSLFCVLIVSSNLVVDYSMYMKHYLWEFLFLVIIFSQSRPESPVYRRIMRRILFLLLLSMFSVQAGIGVVALALAAAFREALPILQGVTRRDAGNGDMASMRKKIFDSALVLLPFLVATVFETVKYYLITRDATANIFTNYIYQHDFGYQQQEGYWEFYVSSFRHIVGIHFGKFPYSNIVIFPLIVLGVAIAGFRRRQDSLPFVFLILVCLGLNAIGLYPLVPGRFTLILVLAFTFFMALAIAAMFERLGPRAGLLAAAAVGMVSLVPSIRVAIEPHGPQARELVATVRSQFHSTGTPRRPLLLTVGSQPLIDAYFGPFGDPAACANHSSQILGWTNRCTASRQRDKDREFAGAKMPWFISNYIMHVSSGANVRDVDVSTVRQWIADYIDFLLRQACTAPEVIILVTQMTRPFIRQLEERLLSGGTLEKLVDENHRGTEKNGIVLLWRRNRPGEGSCDT